LKDKERFYRTILGLLDDEQAMRIVRSTSKNAKSMLEIMQETNIARTTIHRKINSLVKDGILLVENFAISKDGKKTRLFRGRVSNIQIKYERNDMFIIVEENPSSTSKILLHSQKKAAEDMDISGGLDMQSNSDSNTVAVTPA